MSLRSKKNITICKPIPAFIPRKVALGVLHDHSEVITLNPLVLSHHRIPPPTDAPADEASSTWYEIHERIQFIPGIGKAGSSTINFNGVFHNVPWGLQTHIYAPMNIDMRAQYRIAGSQPGVEAAAPRELGLEKLGAPKEGLYLRADIEFKCNVALASFVKSQTNTAIDEMVARMVKKAEQLDSDILQGMIKEERETIISRTSSKEQDPWQRSQYLTQTQSYAQPPPRPDNPWPLHQSRSQIQELDSSPNYQPAQSRPPQAQRHSYQQQQPQPTPPQHPQQYAQPPRTSSPARQPRIYEPPTIVAELDGGGSSNNSSGQPSASSDHSGWSQTTYNSNSNSNSNSNQSYSHARAPSQERRSSRGDVRQQEGGYAMLPSQRQQQTQQQRQGVAYNPAQYAGYEGKQQQGQQGQQSRYYDQPNQGQGRGQIQVQNQYGEYVGKPQQQQQQQGTPQFQNERKYSFDENRLQPELLNGGAGGRRWSAQYT